MNKTRATITGDIYQSELRKNDAGYIDGYVQAADSRPYAVFVRDSDGIVDLVHLHKLIAETYS